MRERLRLLRLLYWQARPCGRRSASWEALRDWRYSAICPACNGAGCCANAALAYDPCEWCAGICTWDLRDLSDEARAMLAKANTNGG